MKASLVLFTTALCVVGASCAATAQQTRPPTREAAAEGWPRELRHGSEVYTIYQPQLDAWNGLFLEGQAAVSVRSGSAEPTFGIVRFTAFTAVNKRARMVILEQLTITRATFPSAPARAEAYAARLRSLATRAPHVIALDRLEAELAILVAAGKAPALPVRNDPPTILFSTVPAMLLHVDGPPVYLPVEGTSLQRVVNTRAQIFRDPAGTHYVQLGNSRLQAAALEGPYRGPAAPVVHVATTPTELIVTEGAARWVPVGGDTQLLYVKNTTGHVFKHLIDQETYVLLSGRWFRTRATSGPWTHVPGDRLPRDFARIPDDSPKENVKASVPGTPQAAEALIANSIPQTAKIDRRTAQLEQPKIDGQPQLHLIDGTNLYYVVNSATPIIVASGHYYALEEGVWFTSPSLRGPWIVASWLPPAIYAIPPSSAVHHVTYVRIYDVTPSVVVVGYTPGYYGTVVAGGVVVYGTGYAYTPWIGRVYVAPPVTYGTAAAIAYSPRGGWAYGQAGVAYNSRTGVAAAGQRGAAYNPYTGNTVAAGRGAAYNPNTGNAVSGAYVRGENGGVARVGGDVYAGKDGNVYRHNESGWQQYQNGSWQPASGARSLEQQRGARSTGESRFQGFQRSGGARPSFGGRRR